MSVGRYHDDWLKAYMFYTRESECPDSYLLWSGLHTLSAAVRRRVCAPWVYHEFYPNLYILLVGPPGVTHKNAAIRFSKQALRAVDIPVSADGISREALIQQMMTRAAADTNALAATPSEFATFIRTSGPSMIEFLTDIFDCNDNFEYTTLTGGNRIIPKPYLTLFAGATPGWMSTEFDSSFIETGFASRTMFVAEVEPRFRKAFANVTPEMREAYRYLIGDLERITQIEGEFRWSESGVEWFRSWYENDLPLQKFDHRLSGYHGRKPVHLLKVAQLVRINEGRTLGEEHLVLDEGVFKKALKLLEALEPNMVRAFRTIGDNPYSTDIERIAADIKYEGRVKASVIYGMNIHSLERSTVEEIITTLELIGDIRTEFDGGKKYLVWTGKD